MHRSIQQNNHNVFYFVCCSQIALFFFWQTLFDFGSTIHPQTALVAQMVKHLPTVRETRIQSLGREDLLKKETATHSSILAGKSQGQRSLAGYMGPLKVRHD